MIIKSAKTIRVEKWVELRVTHNREAFDVSVKTANGKILYDDHRHGLMTSKGGYFSLPEKVRAKHYEQIRKYVERYIK